MSEEDRPFAIRYIQEWVKWFAWQMKQEHRDYESERLDAAAKIIKEQTETAESAGKLVKMARITHGNIEVTVRDRKCCGCGAWVSGSDDFCHKCGGKFVEKY